MEHPEKADAHEREADHNLNKLAGAGVILSPEAAATTAHAMATLAASHRLAALYELLEARIPHRNY